ncbi:hypothetical protein CFAM422_008445 [Trichoderma lentiforme]|uniref:Uncharacterized protein n=1 Tax=Trichoderma lentiforme TaxID=1567552 RepID=A0A9P4XCT8_9HYPO|nr:hypothetical protein CFAM422_008445 [Trichoderma lentiforme]
MVYSARIDGGLAGFTTPGAQGQRLRRSTPHLCLGGVDNGGRKGRARAGGKLEVGNVLSRSCTYRGPHMTKDASRAVT